MKDFGMILSRPMRSRCGPNLRYKLLQVVPSASDLLYPGYLGVWRGLGMRKAYKKNYVSSQPALNSLIVRRQQEDTFL